MPPEVVELLPFGAKGAVQRINELGAVKFAQISRRIFDVMPVVDPVSMFTEEEQNSLLGSSQTGNVSKFTLLMTASELWKNIVYHQLKLQPLMKSLEDAGFSAEMTNAIVKIWSESGLTVCDRLRDMSYSGRPNVRDVSWTLLMNVTSHNIPSMPGAEAVLQFDTDRGSRIVELNRSTLAELHMTLQEVQKNLDLLLEHMR